MTWTPEEGATISAVVGSSILRIASVKGPVALMMPRALMENSRLDDDEEEEEELLREGMRSRTLAPMSLPEASFSREVTSMWLTTVLP